MSELTILCPLCGTANQGGKFCVVCGAKLEGVEPVAPVAPVVAEPAPVVEEPVAAPIPAPVVEEPAFFAEPAPAPAPVAVAEKPQKAKKPVVGIIITLVIFLLLAAFTTLVLLDDMKLRDTVEEKEAAIAELEKTVADQKKEIEVLESTLETSEKDLQDALASLEQASVAEETLAAIISANKDTQLEGAYFASDNLLIMKKGYKAELTIYADWDGEATFEASSKAAEVKWAEETWEGLTTTVTVEGKEAGVCMVTFKNDVDKGTFQVLVIVTE